MSINSRLPAVFALILVSTIALSGCLPADPAERARLSAAEKVIDKLPGVTDTYGETSNGIDAGNQSSFSIAVTATATPAQLETIISALPSALEGTLVGSVHVCSLKKARECSSWVNTIDERGSLRVSVSTIPELPELLAMREHLLGATDLPFELDLGGVSRFAFHLDNYDTAILESAASALRETNADVSVGLDPGPHEPISTLYTTGPDFATALDLWASAFTAISAEKFGTVIELSTDETPWEMVVHLSEASTDRADPLISLLGNWTKHTQNAADLWVNVSWPSNGKRAAVVYELTSTGQTCRSSDSSLCH